MNGVRSNAGASGGMGATAELEVHLAEYASFIFHRPRITGFFSFPAALDRRHYVSFFNIKYPTETNPPPLQKP